MMPETFIRVLTLTALSALITACTTIPPSQTDNRQSVPAVIDANFPPALAEVNFQSHGKRLNGIIYQANGEGPHPTVILLHGYPGNEKNLDLAQSMRRAGYVVLFFHYRGAWGSEGDFSISHVVEDVASASDFLRADADKYRVDADRLILIGHSMGGFAALQGAARDAKIKCTAGLAPANVGLLAQAAAADPDMAKGFAAGADNLPMLSGWNGKAALADLRANAAAFEVTALAPKLAGKSVLLIAGDKDTVLPPEVFHSPMVAAFKAQDGLALTHDILPGDHSFSWSRTQLTNAVLEWATGCEDPSQ